jgi:hypothetical protein
MKKNLVWLASYPKSGNTWLRIFLANYLSNAKTPLPINEVHRFGMGDGNAHYYYHVAGRKVDLRDDNVMLALRWKVLRGMSANNADVNFVKTHNINMVARGTPLIPVDLTKSAIYVMRNPLDMVLSYAKHYGLTHEQATKHICDKNSSLVGDETFAGAFLRRWTDHVESWTKPHPYPVLILRYEDMVTHPQVAFGKVLGHIGLPIDEERLDRAISFASFNELQKQEQTVGFIEKSLNSKDNFFRKGGSGHWRTELDSNLVEEIRRVNRKAMERFGYYDE